MDQYDLDGNFIEKFDSPGLAGASLGKYLSLKNGKEYNLKTLATGIGDCCRGDIKFSHGFVWKFDGTSPYIPQKPKPSWVKEVFQYSLEGVFIARFSSRLEASLSLGSPISGNIISCAQGKIRTALGFRWYSDYQGENVGPLLPRSNSRGVSSFDGEGNLIKSYPSIKAAKLELDGANIDAALKMPKRRCRGLYWRYDE